MFLGMLNSCLTKHWQNLENSGSTYFRRDIHAAKCRCERFSTKSDESKKITKQQEVVKSQIESQMAGMPQEMIEAAYAQLRAVFLKETGCEDEK